MTAKPKKKEKKIKTKGKTSAAKMDLMKGKENERAHTPKLQPRGSRTCKKREESKRHSPTKKISSIIRGKKRGKGTREWERKKNKERVGGATFGN